MANDRFSGSCHCGKVAYNVELDLSRPVVSCNCSMCRRAGTLLSFVPEASFTLERGADELGDYQFNKHNVHHLFCRTCGVKSFARGTSPDGAVMVAVNVRCVPDVDLDKLQVMDFDGASI